MPLTFPLTLAQFLDVMPVREIVFDLGEAMMVDETGGGEVLAASLGARLWQGTLTMAPAAPNQAAARAAVLNLLRQPGGSFMVTDLTRNGPAADPSGALLGVATPQISGVQNGGREIRLFGLPSGYVLSPGDMLSFSYGSSPVRQALHQVVVGGAASFGGLSPWLEVVPSIRDGWTGSAVVTLIRPACKAVLVPGSATPNRSRLAIGEGLSLRFMQTLG